MSAISVQGLGKDFKVGAPKQGYGTFKDLFRQQSHATTKFVALDEISFEVEHGEVLGVIGRNGAGKSTLLKILSRILRPTRGRVELNGRVGSLLEVGAGFHPELTGRENIFLNGAILGLKHSEIARKLDEIIAFSGVEKHLDEPVRHYSSGMYMRLAFSVAAHIEPEILLVDEVLAVGDADFQKKSIERIEAVGERGQTVLLVSHNVQTVLRLCRRALFLDRGRLVEIGDASEVTERYLEIGGANRGARQYAEGLYAPGDSVVRLRGVRARSRDGRTLANVDIGQECGIEIEFDVLEDGTVLFPSFTLVRERTPILWSTDSGTPIHGSARKPGRYTQIAWIPANLLSVGVLRVTVSMHSFRPHCVHLTEPDAIVFHAVETDGGARGQHTGFIEGAIRPLLEWTVEHE